MSQGEEFYVGYQAQMPGGIARHTRLVVVVLLFAAIVTAVAVVVLEKPFEPGVFEFGVVKSFEGVVEVAPVPTLLVTTREGGMHRSAEDRYLLVSPGKHSAVPLVDDFDGHSVHLEGSLIVRDESKMIEIKPGTVRPITAEATPGVTLSDSTPVGRGVITGEIVDSKCFLGVMKPGREKTHRSCAARCIAGGVPPLLATTTVDGEEIFYLLLDSEGRAVNDRILDYVAEPVAIRGEIRRQGAQQVFLADLESIRRTSESFDHLQP
ncbi:MAG: hypothetical protein P8Y44_11650 [Acidobacteriota bacterium]